MTLKPKPFKHLFSTSNFTSTELMLEYLNGLGLIQSQINLVPLWLGPKPKDRTIWWRCFFFFVRKIPITSYCCTTAHCSKDPTKDGSDKLNHWFGKYTFLLGFIMSKTMRGCILNFRLEYEITNLFFLTL